MNLDWKTAPPKSRRPLILLALAAAGLIPAAGALGLAVLGELLTVGGCSAHVTGAAALMPGGRGTLVGASEYGPPGVDLTVHNNDGAYALLRPGDIARLQSGGPLFDALAPLSLLRLTAAPDRTIIARVADWGTGGDPVAGHPRAVDLWWQTADALGLPGSSGSWTGLVRIARAPATGAGNLLDQTPPAPVASDAPSVVCAGLSAASLTVTPGQRARILPDGSAAAPAGAPAPVKAAIAAANQIHTLPYPDPVTHYDGNLAHPWPAYDCSGSVSYVLYEAGLHNPQADVSGTLEAWGAPGAGHWITVYANSTHTWIVVAGLAFDTADYGGPNLPAGTGPRWRSDPTGNLADGLPYVVRHPTGL